MADEFDLKPTSRGEEFLDVILRSLGGDTPDIPQPAWRYEEYLAAIANAIQNGGGGGGSGVLVVHDVNGTLDKTWQEIYDAFPNVCVDLYADGSKASLINIYGSADSGEYALNVPDPGSTPLNYYTEAADGYPILYTGV